MSEFVLKLAGSGPVQVIHPTGRWITVAEAAKRSGLAAGHINRVRLEESWEHRGLARKVRLPSGQQGWEVDEGCDARFARGKSPEQRAAEFDWDSVLTKEQKAQAIARLRVLGAIGAEIEAAFHNTHDIRDKKEIISDFCSRTGLDKSVRTIERWQEKFSSEELPWSLLDGRQDLPPEKKPGAELEPFYKLMEDWYLNQGEPKMATCYRLAKREAIKTNLPFPSLRHAQRHFEAMSIAKQIYARQGPKAFDDQCAAYCQRDFTKIRVVERGKPVIRAMESNDIWVFDHHPCDVMVQLPPDVRTGEIKFARPWLSAAQDIRSRRIIGYRFLLTTPNSSTVLMVLRDAVINAGLRLPRWCYTDNGKDYDAWFWDGRSKRDRKARVAHEADAFTGVYGQLGIGHIHAQPYNAKAKPVERFFRTFEEQFGKFQPTYCGSNSVEKPEQLGDRLKAAPTFEDFVTEATAWIEEVYHNEPHTGHGMDSRSPLEIYIAHIAIGSGKVRPIEIQQLDCCLQIVNKPIKVGRNGIRVAKKTYGKGDPALRQLFGREVMVRIDPADVRYATIWSLDGQRLATLAENDLAIFDTTSDAQHREALAKQAKHNRQLKEVQKRGMRMVKNATEIMIEDQIAEARRRAQDNPLPTPPAPGMEFLNTGLDTSSNDDRPVFKKAVGAESVSRSVNSTAAAFAEED